MKRALLLFACLSLPAQKLEVAPSRVLIDEAASIRVTGLKPSERVTLRAELVDGADERWTSQADFVADAQGGIDASQQAPLDGSYKEVSAMGLVWSMSPEKKGKVGRYQAPRNLGPQLIEIQLLRGGVPLATARLEQVAMGEGVRRTHVTDNGLRGAYFSPAGEGRHPAVLVLGGSEGGFPARRAAWLASRGYAALALAYFHYEDLPDKLESIPLEYFGRALQWLSGRPETVRQPLAVMGASRGGELALQLASMYPALSAVVAYVPANVRYPSCCGITAVPYAWTWGGNPLAWQPVRAGAGPPDMLLRAKIEIEKTNAAVLLISGGEDHVWPSSLMADSVIDRLKHAHFAHPFENLKYPHAGHTAGRPEIVPAWQGETRHPISGRPMQAGGSVKGNAESSLDAIPKVLEFLRGSPSDHGSEK